MGVGGHLLNREEHRHLHSGPLCLLIKSLQHLGCGWSCETDRLSLEMDKLQRKKIGLKFSKAVSPPGRSFEAEGG